MFVPGDLSKSPFCLDKFYVDGTSSEIMTDTEKTAFFSVLTPEEMAVVDTVKAADLLARYRVPLSGFIVTRLIPMELLKENIPEYLRNRIEMQKGCLDKIRKQVGKKVFPLVSEFDNETKGLKTIEGMATVMFGGERIPI
jgi:arsenite-transporting ATPase